MMTNFSKTLIVIIIFGLYFGWFINMALKDSDTCNQIVRLNDGTQYEATQVLSYSSGMSSIRLCTGEVLRTPTINIKMVEELKK